MPSSDCLLWPGLCGITIGDWYTVTVGAPHTTAPRLYGRYRHDVFPVRQHLTVNVQTLEGLRQGPQPAGAAPARRADCEVLQRLQRLQQRLQLLLTDAGGQDDLLQAAGAIAGQLSERPGAEPKPAQVGLLKITSMASCTNQRLELLFSCTAVGPCSDIVGQLHALT